MYYISSPKYKRENINADTWEGKDMGNDLTPKMEQFDEIVAIIDNARIRALKAVNT